MEHLVDRVKKILAINPSAVKKQAIMRLEAETARPYFWQEPKVAGAKMQQLALLQTELKQITQLEDFLVALEIGDTPETAEIEAICEQIEFTLYFSGLHDSSSAIVSIHSGQGGVEAMDWADMLYRMYSRFFTIQKWSVEELEYDKGGEAGIKTVTLSVTGTYAYGFLKYEAGVHRLVRLSPFNADHLRQTSFALVEVMPEVSGSSELIISDEEIEWDFFRAGGHGGQNVNKVSSAVRLTHIPSGLVVTSQKERDQSRNREIALRLLRAKLLAQEEEKRRAEELKLKGAYVTPGWGNQIRSYILHPYHLVKDLRTSYEETNTESVLDGNIKGFLEAELRFFANLQKENI